VVAGLREFPELLNAYTRTPSTGRLVTLSVTCPEIAPPRSRAKSMLAWCSGA
jgi:hypothetical protein